MFPGYDADAPTREQFDIGIAAIGMSVVEVERTPEGTQARHGPLQPAHHRRHPMTLTGPGAGTDFVKRGRSDRTHHRGHLRELRRRRNPMGHSPFRRRELQRLLRRRRGGAGARAGHRDRLNRYGVDLEPSELKSETFDHASTGREPNEANRLATSSNSIRGNPIRPRSSTARWEGSARRRDVYVTGDGTVVAYSGDDQRFDYMYKFVSCKKMSPGKDAAAMAANLTMLDEGTLYVTKLCSDIPTGD